MRILNKASETDPGNGVPPSIMRILNKASETDPANGLQRLA